MYLSGVGLYTLVTPVCGGEGLGSNIYRNMICCRKVTVQKVLMRVFLVKNRVMDSYVKRVFWFNR